MEDALAEVCKDIRIGKILIQVSSHVCLITKAGLNGDRSQSQFCLQQYYIFLADKCVLVLAPTLWG
jgi:hypothetical protein